MTTSTSSKKNDYYNDNLTAVGYLNRARYVGKSSRNKGKPYLAITFCKYTGSKEQDNLVKTYMSLTVKGARAIELIEQYMESINNRELSVFAAVRCSDITVETYQDKKGNIQAAMRGRLHEITYLKVGDEVINVKPDAPSDTSSDFDEVEFDDDQIS